MGKLWGRYGGEDTVSGTISYDGLWYVCEEMVSRLNAFLLTYLSKNRLTTYTYDGLNRRISKSVDSDGDLTVDTATYFVYDREDVILDFVDADGDGPGTSVLEKRYLHGPGADMILAQEDIAGSTGLLWLLTDHLGTTRDIIDNTGAVQNHIKYDSFGQIIDQSSTTFTTRYLYTGREWEGDTNLYYYRARFFDPTLGRFTQRDPIGFEDGVNRYEYVGSNPVRFTDPSGLSALDNLMGTGNVFGDPSNLGLFGSEVDENCSNPLPVIQEGLEWLGFAPGVGAAPDLINAVLYLLQGDLTSAGINVLAAIPVFGDAGRAVDKANDARKLINKATNGVDDLVSNVGDDISKWLGKDAKVITNEAGDRIIQSADGLREIRFDLKRPSPHKNPHTHLIEYKKVKNKKVEIRNDRIYPKGVTPE